ncbi:MAG: hypothetical protein ACP5U2_06480 [Bryobacteraceae bacterium]
MARKRITARNRLAEWLERRRPERISEEIWAELEQALAPISEDYLRRLLRQTGLALDPLVEGVRQDSFESLERTLLALAREYQAAMAAGDRGRAAACRRLVIRAKDHARWALRRGQSDPEQKVTREEMLLWMMTWLENPGVFADWLKLRKPIWQAVLEQRADRQDEGVSQ